MTSFIRATALSAIFTIGTLAHAAPAKLLSPWDGHAVALTAAPYPCPAIDHIAPDLTTDGFYRLDDPTHSIIDPVRQAAYNASANPVKFAGQAIVKSADDFRTTGSRAAAECTMTRVLAMAREKSLTGHMSSGQAYYVQGWVAGAVAIAYLKVREASSVTPDQATLIGNWLHAVGEQTRGFYDQHNKTGKGNNHLYWAGVQLVATGVAANNRSDYDWGLATYDNGVNQIQPDGSLPLEMARGARALHYHLYALAPLVLLAEFGEANHQDLYAHNGGAIHRLVKFSLDGIADPAPFAKATGVQQEAVKRPSGDQIGWAPPYARRFPNPTLSKYIANAPTLSVYYLGGLPPE
jgi:poly(beta-D-mannuronate) lyase